jgi:uncharacterized MAPEG superfamily protein
MAIAHWCLLVVVLLPYLLSVAARSGAGYTEYVADPRAYSDRLDGWHRRAHLAHLNAFEAVPGFIAGLLVAELTSTPRAWVDGLAVAFAAFRILHALLYIGDRPRTRSHAWRFGMLCVIGLFIVSAVASVI